MLFLGCGIRAGMNGAKPTWLEGCVWRPVQCCLMCSAFQQQLQTCPRTACAYNLGISRLEHIKMEPVSKAVAGQGPGALSVSLVLVSGNVLHAKIAWVGHTSEKPSSRLLLINLPFVFGECIQFLTLFPKQF